MYSNSQIRKIVQAPALEQFPDLDISIYYKRVEVIDNILKMAPADSIACDRQSISTRNENFIYLLFNIICTIYALLQIQIRNRGVKFAIFAILPQLLFSFLHLTINHLKSRDILVFSPSLFDHLRLTVTNHKLN